MGRGEPGDIGGRGAHGGGHVHGDAEVVEKGRHLFDVVAVAEAERGGAEDVGGDMGRALAGGGEVAGDLEEGLIRAEVFLALVGGQFQRDHRDGEAHGFGQPAGIVLDELCGAGGADDQGLWPEPLIGVAAGLAEEIGGVGAEVPGLEGGVGDGRAVVPPLDHREEEIGIGVALGGVEHVVEARHARGDAHGAHMGRAFICPDGELHEEPPDLSIFARMKGRGLAREVMRAPPA